MLQYQCLNATIPLTCTLANEYPPINEISKKNGTVRGDCIACDALFSFIYLFFFTFKKANQMVTSNKTRNREAQFSRNCIMEKPCFRYFKLQFVFV